MPFGVSMCAEKLPWVMATMVCLQAYLVQARGEEWGLACVAMGGLGCIAAQVSGAVLTPGWN